MVFAEAQQKSSVLGSVLAIWVISFFQEVLNEFIVHRLSFFFET